MQHYVFVKKVLLPIGVSLMLLSTIFILWMVQHYNEAEANPEVNSKKNNEFYVYLGGEVHQEGMIQIHEGATLKECIEKAGGLTQKASQNINFAYRIYDNVAIYIYPEKAKIIADIGDGLVIDDEGVVEGKINLNTADAETLMLLTGVGEVTAKHIIDYRNEHGDFKTIEEVMNIPGIKEGRFSAIKEDIVAR